MADTNPHGDETTTTGAVGGETAPPLAPGASDSDPSGSRSVAEGPGSRIGPYKLAPADRRGRHGHRLHGRADRAGPPHGRAQAHQGRAWTRRQVLARFEAERQALALMDHPNIAKVLDAGTTDGGRPYFVMELVKGVPDHPSTATSTG